MSKQIVAKFNKGFEKIEFYEIEVNYKEYTIIRKQGTMEYYIWNNKEKLLSNRLDVTGILKNKSKKEIAKIIDEKIEQYLAGVVFFWADSKFVTEYGAPEYPHLVDIYKQIIAIRGTELNLLYQLNQAKYNGTFFQYIRLLIEVKRFLGRQRHTIRELEKEFKIIW